MRILGIDPGSIVCGYGVVDRVSHNNIVLVEYGVVEAKKQFSELPRRLEAIFQRLSQVIERTSPDESAVEQVFFSKNAQSLLKLSHARGVAMLAATLRQIPVAEYTANEVKRSVTGKGHASKEQVQFMVKSILGLKETHKYLDATDALAVAITHALKRNEAATKQSRSWKEFVEDNPNRVVKKK